MMTRDDFLLRLRRGLEKLPTEELENVLRYYSEYFDEAGEENEERVLKELGDPMIIAQQILAESMVRDIVAAPQAAHRQESTPPKKAKQGLSAVWTVILAVFAAPIALPIAIAIAAVAFALVLAAAAVVVAFLVTAIVLIAGGVAGFFLGCVSLLTHFFTGLMGIGLGITLCGLGLLLFLPMLYLARSLFTGIARYIGRKVFQPKGDVL